jgi:hypothetical protein
MVVTGCRAVESPGGHHGQALQVEGEQPSPTQVLAPCAATQAALEVADPGLDPDPPVRIPTERPGPLQLRPGRAQGARALEPDPPNAKQ